MHNHPVRVNRSCPAWCVAIHDPEDPPSDYLHEALCREVPCVVLERHTNEDGTVLRNPAAATLYLEQYRYAADRDTWLYLGDGFHGFDLSPESARRLTAMLLMYLEGVNEMDEAV